MQIEHKVQTCHFTNLSQLDKLIQAFCLYNSSHWPMIENINNIVKTSDTFKIVFSDQLKYLMRVIR